MSPIGRLYLKIFLVFGPGFAICMAIVDWLTGDGFHWAEFMTRMIIFGGLMTLVLVSIHIAELRAEGIKKFTNDNISSTQKRAVVSPLSKEQLIQKIATDPVLGAMKINETEHGVILKSGMTVSTWGDRISIEEVTGNGVSHEYKIVSKPILKSTLLDYGSNYSHVTRLEKLMMDANSN